MSIKPSSIEGLVANLEEDLNSYMLKYDSYQSIQKALEQGVTVNVNEVERLLTVCCRDLKEDMQLTASALSTISALIIRIKTEPYLQSLELLPSALAIIKIMKLICQSEAISTKIGVLPVLCSETLLSYPDQTLITLTTLHSYELLEIIKGYCRQDPTQYLVLLAFKLIGKLLEILPIEKKQEFVTEGLSVWFSSVIPAVFDCSLKSDVDIRDCISMLDTLANLLVPIDYQQNPAWKKVLECIINTTKYPHIMKIHLTNGNDCWYRLWIVIIRLLKNEITKVNDKSGSPINALLPVVETAFKMDSKYRCKAFLCWNALIDNFSSQINETFINKRIKLLMVPLKSNNVKTEETAIAKLNTWWHLIRQFHSVMDEYIGMILIPFIRFCFGYVNASGKMIIPAVMLSNGVKRLSLEALVEVIGHVDCENCVTIPKLKSKLINTKILVEHWKDWLYSIETAIKSAASDTSEQKTRQCTCIWKSFLMTITELPANNLRNDLLLELVQTISQFREDSHNDVKLADIVFNILIMSFFDNTEFKTLFNSKRDDQIGPISNILLMLVNPCFDTYYRRLGKKELISKFKQIINVIMDPSIYVTDDITLWILKHVLHAGNDVALLLWTALVQTICDYNLLKHNLMNILLWPLQALSTFNIEVTSVAWYDWYTFYNLVNPKLENCAIDDQILNVIMSQNKIMKSPSCFLICASLAVLKSALVKGTKYETQIESLLQIMMKVDDYQPIEGVFPILVDTITLTLNKLEESTNASAALHTLLIVEIILRLITQVLKTKNDNVHDVLILTENLFKPLKRVMEIYCHICFAKYSKVAVVYELMDCLPFVSKNCSLHKDMISILYSLSKLKLKPALHDRINAAIEVYGNKNDDGQINADEKPTNADSPKQKFSTPEIKDARKKLNKEPSIVNTVVENGEEFVVVKSNWKFNPRKLTDNQKEKFKRKREDIPALYQDLSQSQDEFKLNTWKTDSQDTTTTSSKSTSKSTYEDIPTLLKNMPSTDVVPKIIENILLDSATSIITNTTNTTTNTNMSEVATDKSNIQEPKGMLGKDTKSPRMALKDRVFRNVRNLMEKTNLPNEVQLNGEHLDQTINENILKTLPTMTKPPENLTNSVPPKIVYERPSRVTKRPSKFDDSEVIPLKKKEYKKSRDSLDVNVLPIEMSHKSVPEVGVQVKVTKDQQLSPENEKELYVIQTRRRSQNDLQKHTELINKPVHQESELAEMNKEQQLCSSTKKLIILKKRRRSENDSQQDIESSDKPVRQIRVQAEVHKEKEESSSNKQKVIVATKRQSSQNNSQLDIEISDKPVLDQEKEANSGNKKRIIFAMERQLSQNDLQQDVEIPVKPILHKEKEANLYTKKKVTMERKRSQNHLQQDIEMTDKPVQQLKVQGELYKVKDVSLDHKNEKHSQIEEDKCDKSNKTGNKMEISVVNTTNELNIEDKEKAIDRCNEKIDAYIDTGAIGDSVVNVKLNSQQNIGTPTKEEFLTSTSKVVGIDESKSSVKKKKSRIEKQLLIDMVESHPLLQVQSEKRLTRKTLATTPPSISKRNSLKNKYITEPINAVKPNKKLKETDKLEKSSNISDRDLPQKLSQSSEDLPMSEDIIESSQDSSVTTLSITSAKHCTKKVPIVKLDNDVTKLIQSKQIASTQTQDLLHVVDDAITPFNASLPSDLSKEDIELPENKTAVEEKAEIDLTENMDTQPIDVEISCSDVINITDEGDQVIVINDTDNTNVGPDTLETAEADTQPMTVEREFKNTYKETNKGEPEILVTEQKITTSGPECENESNKNYILNTQDDLTKTGGTCSPLMDEAQKTKDFLNDTIEISPIKTMSPIEEKNSSSPEISSDYVVIKLTSPVQSNGEPIENTSHSPEIFTEDKVSPDKRDQSPPRPEITVNNNSPSSSLSLKKNRLQVRSCRRAAQMISLLYAGQDQIQPSMNSERSVDPEETKKYNVSTTPARRNLRILYNSVGENNNKPDESEDSENFLKLKKVLPPVNCSPSVPILKRKLAEIADEAATSPASKRKRVSFHDPPVSTTVAVEKYIEPIGTRSPQSTTLKRLEKQQRGPMKSTKRLDNAFQLDTTLTKAVESFSEEPSVINSIEDTEVSSMDHTPAVEIVKTSDLNDTDPICADLLDCDDPIDNIAAELSSPAMKELFVKELKGKVETVADLAKMTELEVNRLCIKAPKVNIARKVLNHYASKKTSKTTDQVTVDLADAKLDRLIETNATKKVNVDTQTNQIVTVNREIQTSGVPVIAIHTQTDVTPASHASVQTNESGSKSTNDLLSCLSERPDFIEKLTDKLEESSIQQITDKLSFSALLDLLEKKMTTSNGEELIRRLLGRNLDPSNHADEDIKLSILQDYICNRFDSNRVMLFCSQLLLQKSHDKPA